MSAFSQRVDAALNGGMMNTEQEKPAATTAAGIGMGRESAFTRAVRNARGGALDEVEMPQAKTPVDPELGFWQRVFSGGKGAAKSYASGGVNAAGSAVGVMASLNDAAFNAEYGESYKAAQRSHEYWTKMLAEATTDEERQRAQTGLSVAQNALSSIERLRSTMSRDIRGAENALYETADDLSQSAAEDIAQAKQGAGKVGQFAVDVGVAGAQLAGDIGIGALTGGGALIPMAVRAFGSGTQQARQEGATLGQQVAYGAGSAALSVGIEKLSNFAKPLSKAFGAGFADDFITKLSGRLAQTAAGRMALSALGEGTEEAVETLLDPLLQRVTYDKDAAITADTLAEAGYNFLVGGTLGGILGGAGEVAAAKTPAAPNGAALGAEAAANGENATTATPAEEKAAEAIVVGERTTAAERPAEYMQKNSGNDDQVLNMPSSDDPQPTPEVPVGAIASAYSDSTLTHEAENVKKAPDAESSVGAAEHGFDPFTAAQNEFGTLPSGEHPVRPDDVPASTDGTDRVSQSVVTAKGARVTPDEFVPLIEKETMKGRFSFIPITNDATVQAVEDVIMRDGWEKALTDWTADVRKGKAGAQITAMGAMLYNNAVNAGQEQTALDILTDYQMAVRNTARGLQASRIMKKLTPESRLYMMERSIQNMVDNLGLDEPITLPQELVDAYTNAEDETAADKVVDEIQQYVADQIPPTIMDKWTALRYTNMLGNFKTQVRNAAGNVGMAVVTEMKNAIAAGLETLAQGKAGRAHAILPGKALMDAARADFRTQQDEVMAGQRYADSMSEDAFARGVQEKQRIFKNPVLEGYRKATNWAMNNEHFGDAAFSRRAYARALAGYLKANNVTAEQFTDAEWQAKHGKFLDKARSFAAHEAQEATFRDHNVLSDWVSRIGRRADTPRAVRAVAEGLLPFRRTPANILVRAAEYSPLGIVKNAVDVARKAKGADISGVDIINGIAKTMTGTGIFALGMLLRNAGMLRGGDDEDEEQAAFDDLTGHQPYSLELEDGTSITLDWLTPASMPLFMGVELMDLIQDEGLELKDLEQALTSIADPMLQMSMLQGISDTLGDLQYSQSNNLGQTVITAALGYLTQGLTNSLVGQLERTVDGGNDMTYVDKESALPAWAQREIGAASRKIPGWDYNQIPYIDAWGREEESGDVLERAAHNLFNPAYVSKVDVDKLEGELQRLYDATGDVAVLPDRAAKSFTMDGATRYLTAEEYVQFAKASGQDSYRYASEAVQSAAYRSMSDEERSELIGKLYSYAKYKAKKGVEPKYESDTYRKAAEAEKKGISPVEYYTGRMRSDADGNGTTSKAEAQKYLDSQSGLSNAKKVDLWDIICTTGAKNPYQ